MKNTKVLFGKRGKKGLTGLETAIILISFVIVAAAFAFAVLNLGFSTTQRSGEVMKAGLGEATSSIELNGAVIATSVTDNNGIRQLANVTIYLKTGVGKTPIDMSSDTLTVSYLDPYVHVGRLLDGVNLEVSEVRGDGDNLLEYGEVWKVVVMVGKIYEQLNPGIGPIGPNERFVVEIKPSVGSILTVERRLPPAFDPIMELG